MRVAIYARVSTKEKGQDPELQLRELREYAKVRGMTVFGEYVDTLGGAKESRPQLDRMMIAVQRRRVDAVLVWKLDRFGRSLRHLVNALAELNAVGVAFMSLRDNLDLGTPTGRLMFHVIAAMAEFERELMRERTRAGLANVRARGVRLGRPSRNPDIAQIRQRRAAGASWRAIGRELGIAPETCRQAAQNG